MKRIDALIRGRTEERRIAAEACVGRILNEAGDRGIRISVVGSLGNGRFRVHSDVDLLVHGRTDPARRATVERLVADGMRGSGLPYDLIFEADIGSDRARELLHDRL